LPILVVFFDHFPVCFSPTAIELWQKGFGPTHPVWYDFWCQPEVRDLFHSFYRILLIYLVIFPTVLTVWVVYKRKKSLNQRWILTEDGVDIYIDTSLQQTYRWHDLNAAYYKRKGNVLELDVKNKLWSVALPGIDRELGNKFVEVVKQRIKDWSAQQSSPLS
jgi:hypothetical protein